MAASAPLPPDVQVTGIALTSLVPQGSISLPVAPGGGPSLYCGGRRQTPDGRASRRHRAGAGQWSTQADGDGRGCGVGSRALRGGGGHRVVGWNVAPVPVELFDPVKATQAVERAATAVCSTSTALRRTCPLAGSRISSRDRARAGGEGAGGELRWNAGVEPGGHGAVWPASSDAFAGRCGRVVDQLGAEGRTVRQRC